VRLAKEDANFQIGTRVLRLIYDVGVSVYAFLLAGTAECVHGLFRRHVFACVL